VSSPPSVSRHLDWQGCFNARDLGGLPLVDGGETRWGQLIRSDSLDQVEWSVVRDYGVRTVIDLRNDDERAAAPKHALHIPLDVSEDREFWDVWASGWQFGTPLYYGPHLERFPERSAAVLRAIARAEPGGVVFHCGGGRDRVGQIAMLVLALAGVSAEHIAADYALSYERLPALYAARGEEDQRPSIEAHLAERGTTVEEVLIDTLRSIDVEEVLRAGGSTDEELAAVRSRLLR
jgi:protein-tyrosine phosphatase